MNLRRFVVPAIGFLLLGIIGTQVLRLYEQRQELKAELGEVAHEVALLEAEEEKLEDEIEYTSNARNAIKELKSLFNYVEQGEELLILVPPAPPE
ncbi:MAG: hypothetical protein HY536_01820 [Candidatus Colwellbacteria bacterium]|nr:hypothetical protein [Candidatus Colwellbacteria bacterium]